MIYFFTNQRRDSLELEDLSVIKEVSEDHVDKSMAVEDRVEDKFNANEQIPAKEYNIKKKRGMV